MNAKLAIAAAVGVAAAALLLISFAWSHRRPDRPDRPTRPRADSPRVTSTALRPSAPSSRQMTAADVDRLLPFPRAQIAEAGELARRFTAAYATYRYNESPEQYLQRLLPMMSPQLRTTVWLTATDPTIQNQRSRAQAAATGQAQPEAIRSLGPSSITFDLTAAEHTTTPRTTWTETTHYSVTVTRHSDQWLVYAIEHTTTGDNGDEP